MAIHVPLPQLAAFRQGRIASDAEIETIAAHLAECTVCQESHATLPEAEVVQLVCRHETPACEVAETEVVEPASRYWPLPEEMQSLRQHWDVLEFLGAGGMGAVYKARRNDGSSSAEVAIKVMQLDLIARNASVKRLERELQLINALEPHPNLLSKYEGTAIGPFYVLEMQFIPGEDLERFADHEERAGRPLSVSQACSFVLQVLAGLDHAWRTRRLVHRDLKPRNLIKTPENTVVIIDFGLAKIAGDDHDHDLTMTGARGGSPQYCAPEQAHDLKRADTRSDLYSVACTLYRLLSGHPPFCERTGHNQPWKVQNAHDSLTPEPLAKLRPQVPEALSRVVQKMLAKDPAQRYPSPAKAAQALLPFVEQAEVQRAFIWLPPELRHMPAMDGGGRRWTAIMLAICLPIVVWLGVMLLVRTKAGTVEIELDDPKAEIRIDNKPLDRTKIKVRQQGQKHWLVIEAIQGEHQVKVTAPGCEVFSQNVTVRSGEASPLRVALQPVVDAVVDKPSDDSPPEQVATPEVQVVKAEHWTSLFNGKNLTGWELDEEHGEGQWKVVDGVLDGSDTTVALRTMRHDYADFHLRMEVQLSLNANSGVFLRVDPTDFGRHYECDLWIPADSNWYTVGTIHRVPGGDKPRGFGAIVRETPARPDQWFKHEVIVRGGEIEILVDGEQVARWTDPEPWGKSGAIGLQNFLRRPGQTIRFRNLEVREFEPSNP
jgi:hypothetical protein